jgi:hypothetical protein
MVSSGRTGTDPMRAFPLKKFTISARDGTEIHAGTARNWGDYLEGLVKGGVSLAGADLAGASLARLSLDGADLRGACLDGADLTGASLCTARLDAASMRGVVADGLRARNAILSNVDLGPLPAATGPAKASRLLGADLNAAVLRRARLDGADLSNANCRATKFLAVRASGTNLSGADLSSAEFAMSRFSGCDLTGADLSSRSGAPGYSLPDRTEGVVAFDNTYAGAKLDVGVRTFVRDRLAGRIMRRASFGVSALAITALAGLVPEEVIQHAAGAVAGNLPAGALGHLVGGGLVLVATVKLAALAREKVEELAGEYLGRRVMRGLRAAKSYASEAVRRGADAANLVAALAVGPGSAIVARSLKATSAEAAAAGVAAGFAEVLAGRVRVLLCDRRHLALALARLHTEQTRGSHLQRDLVLVREAEPDAADDAPLSYRIGADGSTAAVWGPASRPRSASWNPDGKPLSALGFPQGAPSSHAAKAAFEAALWKDHGLRRPYVTGSHQLAAGRDGSIQFVHEKTGQLNNPRGPAYLAVDGSEMHFRRGEPVPAPAPAP